ncbi:hypothetical protein MH117_22215 [Paenibacillus sp. ACRRX]|uniref:hypothetical protein n=1 Tax=unclassified Paenibacillus TaxID=185978 RepID=UPI001EF60D20|nr:MULTISPECIES: hypothetical protein [unclassified Paenibacillus]MCG7410133.1 hypothetical protein [Paenibacillus sp. ACRRX]MDK8183706.1 hypothetical protein [Paenibacillus sp. UMB4589-SE434]
MTFTFPVDSNNKAGAVKSLGTNGFTVPSQSTGFEAKEVKRIKLEARVSTRLTFTGTCEAFDIHNFGVGDIFVNIGAAATVDGADCIMVPEGMGYTLNVRGAELHVISERTPKIQVVGVR